jgi:hypothetical protein
MKAFIAIAVSFLVSHTTFATIINPGSLQCRFGSWNPSYELNISENSDGALVGNLEKIINGFAGSERTHLGIDPLKFKLNPALCEFKILSQKNSASEFLLVLNANSKESYSGEFRGSLFESSEASCEKSFSELAMLISNVCQKHSDRNKEFNFSKLSELRKINEMD